jgi:hypothetical protein
MANSPLELKAGYVRGLQALGAAGYFEFNRLPVVQRFIAFRLNRGEMDENVLTGLALDESKSLAGIEPLHCSLFSQLCFSFLFELFGAVPTAFSQNKRGCKCGLAAPSINLKVLQEQQTQIHSHTVLFKCPVKCFCTVRTPTTALRASSAPPV